jgi:hypothetical protein
MPLMFQLAIFIVLLSLPGLTGQSSNPDGAMMSNVGGYWMPAFAGMTSNRKS